MIWYESGGVGSRVAMLLHGQGATAAVWTSVRRALQEQGSMRWLVVDLGGHGKSDWESSYSVGQLAAPLAELVRQEARKLFIVGHSLGAYVALALASGWFGVATRGVLCIGPKITWPAADLQTAAELAARPVRWYPTEQEAWTRYRRVSGLTADIAPGNEWLARGTAKGEGGWRLAQDPRTFSVAGAPFTSLVASATAPILFARGERDPMVSVQELSAYAVRAHDIPGAGHNAHIENPQAVLALLEQLASGV